jgi:hypothetical protein
MTYRQNLFLLFTTGFTQVLLVAINTWQIVHEKWVGMMIVGFLISFLWTWNVKKAAFGNMTDRLTYAGGAALGTVCGVVAMKLMYHS